MLTPTYWLLLLKKMPIQGFGYDAGGILQSVIIMFSCLETRDIASFNIRANVYTVPQSFKLMSYSRYHGCVLYDEPSSLKCLRNLEKINVNSVSVYANWAVANNSLIVAEGVSANAKVDFVEVAALLSQINFLILQNAQVQTSRQQTVEHTPKIHRITFFCSRFLLFLTFFLLHIWCRLYCIHKINYKEPSLATCISSSVCSFTSVIKRIFLERWICYCWKSVVVYVTKAYNLALS